MRTTRYLALATLSCSIAAASMLTPGCGDSGGTGSTGTGGGSSSGAGGDIGFDAGMPDAEVNPDAACVAQSAEATFSIKPVDIILLVDNSNSMTEEIIGVQKNINKNFASLIEGSGIDYRVILVSQHGSAVQTQSICIEAPLSGIPAAGCAVPPAQPVNNPPHFYHYSTAIGSNDPWCKIFNTLFAPDEFNLFPSGWMSLLRPEALKTFIVLTDDNPVCGSKFDDLNTQAGGTAAAQKMADELFALSPLQFGTKDNPNFNWYSIVGLADNTTPGVPYLPSDPLVDGTCPSGVRPGYGYQALSVLTGGLRFPVCDTSSYDAVFKEIAKGVVQGSKIVCEFPVPDAPPGETIDLSTVIVQYKPGGTGAQQLLKPVADANSCQPDSFYIAKDMNGKDTIYLCPQACGVVQEDFTAKINVLFGCAIGSSF